MDNTDVKMKKVERWKSLDEISKHLGVSTDTIRISEVDAWVESGQSANADK